MMKPNLVKDEKTGEVEIKAVETPVKEAKPEIEILAGKKVKVDGRNEVFVISQKLSNGKVSILGPEGLILYVKPEELKFVK